MKQLLLILALASSFTAFNQNSNKDIAEKQQQSKPVMDSSFSDMDSLVARQTRSLDSAAMARSLEQNNRNLDGLVSMMREREQQEKKKMWMRLGFGVLLAGVGVYGITRKKKKVS